MDAVEMRNKGLLTVFFHPSMPIVAAFFSQNSSIDRLSINSCTVGGWYSSFHWLGLPVLLTGYGHCLHIYYRQIVHPLSLPVMQLTMFRITWGRNHLPQNPVRVHHFGITFLHWLLYFLLQDDVWRQVRIWTAIFTNVRALPSHWRGEHSSQDGMIWAVAGLTSLELGWRTRSAHTPVRQLHLALLYELPAALTSCG